MKLLYCRKRDEASNPFNHTYRSSATAHRRRSMHDNGKRLLVISDIIGDRRVV
jgi:hypothetical protein